MAVTRIKNNQLTDGTINAAAKLQDFSLTSGKIANNLTYGSDLTVTGNLTVQGNVTAVDTYDLVVEDPLILLAKDQTGTPTLDIGFIGERGDSDNIAFVWDESADQFVAAFTTDGSGSTNTTITVDSYASMQVLNLTASDVDITGNLTFDGTITGNVTVTGNVDADNFNATTSITAASATVSGNITGGNLISNNDVTTATVSASGNVTADNLVSNNDVTTATVSASGNITGENLTSNANIDGVTVTASGDLEGNNAVITNDVSTVTVSASGNVTADNLVSNNDVTTATVSASGNITGENLTSNANIDGVTVTASGNLEGNNAVITNDVTTATVSASGNVTADNLVSNNDVTTATVSASGNITGQNLTSNANIDGITVTASGNLEGNNAVVTNNISADTIDSTGNLTAGNITTTGVGQVGSLEVDNDALIAGNLTVQGNLTYINVDDLQVEDPVIALGGGPNGASLTTDDGMDRGTKLSYYSTGNDQEQAAFFGWDNSSGNMLAAANVTIANNVVTVQDFGTLEGGDLYFANANITDTATIANLETTTISASGNITGGNLISNNDVTTATVSASGNVTADNLVSNNDVTTATVSASGNITGENLTSNANIDGVTITASGDLEGNNAVITNDVSTATVSASGNVTGDNLISNNDVTTATVTASGNITGQNLISNANIDGITVTASGNLEGNNAVVTNDTGSNTFTATTSVTTPSVTSTGALSITSGANANITLDPDGSGVVILEDETANRMLFTGANKEIATDANATFDGANLAITGQLTVDNVTVDGQDITSTGAELTINDAGGDVDFRVEGDTDQNLLLVDAGTDTVLIGTSTTIAGAKLVVDSTESIVVPVGTTLERPAVAATGMLRFNSTSGQLEYYDNTAWVGAGTDFTVVTADSFTGDGSTVAFTLSEDATTAGTIVSINGVVQIPTTAYSVSGNTLTFTEAPVSSDVIDARILVTTDTVVGIVTSDETGSFESAVSGATFESTANIVPSANVTYNLGSDTLRWNELYLAGTTITLGDIVIKDSGNGQIGFFQDDGTTPATIDSDNVDTTTISDGNSNVAVASSGGNVAVSVGGNANVGLFTTSGLTVTGTGSFDSEITIPSIAKSGTDGVGNIGSSSNAFDTVFAKATSAQYADLAEMYEADQPIHPGTVVHFGGDKEVTVCDQDACARVAGVVSTNPSYLMNSHQPGEHVVAVALTGRVPVQVVGSVRKGDMMVSAGNGHARAESAPGMGTVIGKALEDFDGESGVIEVVVGRL